MAERRRRHDGRVGDAHAVVDLVLLLDAAEDADGVLHARLVHQHRLEAALEGGVLLDLAVLVQRRRPDQAQLAAGQRRLEHVAGVHRALGLTGADDGVQLVDEQNHAPLAGGRLGDDRLQALLELAAVLGAGQQRAHLQGDDALFLEAFGHVALDDPLSQALNDGGLAHARLADQHRVVLGAPQQDLNGAADFLVAADDRIQLALFGQLGQVHAVLRQRFEGPLAVFAFHVSSSPYLVNGLLQLVRRRQAGEVLFGYC